ncbi:MAG: SMP-30/gluconolactonase/LRE family protein [Ktedonobacteraceae bacterium]|nr:SMP-30/gluconolactonase/LRE family protein [Ktedonobacteraceae bacterium]
MYNVEHILPCRNTLGEGALWSIDEQKLYWVDIRKGSFSRFDPASDKQETFQVGLPIGVLALRASGGLIMATKNGFALWDEQQRELKFIAQPYGEDPTMRFNDGAVDARGRFWAGSMLNDESPDGGTLYRLDPDGSLHAMITKVGVPNGIGWSPDNTIMYFTDSHPSRRTIYAYDYDIETGAITNSRIFSAAALEKGTPDGLTVDSEGYVWSAFWDGAKIVRFDPTGKIERTIDMPVLRPTSCVFGGAGLTDLYITSAAVDEPYRAQYPLSGDLFCIKTDIKGQPKHKFGG